MTHEEGRTIDSDRVHPCGSHGVESLLELSRAGDLDGQDLEFQGLRCLCGNVAENIGRREEIRDPSYFRSGFLEQLQVLGEITILVWILQYSRHCTARPCDALDKTGTSEVLEVGPSSHHDRNCTTRTCRLQDAGKTVRDDDVNGKFYQLPYERRYTLGFSLRLPPLDRDVLAIDPAMFTKPLKEGRTLLGESVGTNDADSGHLRHLPCLLRLDGEGRKQKADSENDREPNSPHQHLGRDGWRESSRGLVGPSGRSTLPSARRATACVPSGVAIMPTNGLNVAGAP